MGANGLLLVTLLGMINCQFQTQPSCTIPTLCKDVGTSIIDPRILTPGTSGSVGPPLPGGGTFPGGPGIPGGGAIGPPGIVGPGPGVNIVTPANCPNGYISCTNVTCGTPSVQPGNGNGFAAAGAFPWQAFIRNNNNIAVRNGYAGGGVLLDQYHVLTAAHKVTNLTSISVLMGVYNTGNLANAQTSQVAQVWIHSNYNQTYLKNDVAVLRLATPILINNSSMPMCLPQSTRNFQGSPASACVVSGWGQTSFTLNDAPTQALKQAHVPIVTNQQCAASYSNILGAVNAAAYLDFPFEICAGGQAQLDACTQDGGSPLICNDTPTQFSLAGLVLWGKNCGQPGTYGVYLNVPAYVSWIQCTIQCLQGLAPCNNCPASRFL